MKTIEEIKDDVANELIYSRPSNYTFKGWSNWKRYFYPSAKELEEAWGKVSERYANAKAKALLDEAAEKATTENYSETRFLPGSGDPYTVNEIRVNKESILSLIPKEL